jgi:hypothetical protein
LILQAAIRKFKIINFEKITLALTASLRSGGSAIMAAMPFIDDDLLWCPDNDGRMVDLSTCLQDAVANANAMNPNGEMPGGSCDLSALDPLSNDSDELLRQLTENTFELDNFFNEFSAADIKVSAHINFKSE